MSKNRIFTKKRVMFLFFCQIKSVYSNFSHRELSIGTITGHTFLNFNFGHILGKEGPYLKNIYALLYNMDTKI